MKRVRSRRLLRLSGVVTLVASTLGLAAAVLPTAASAGVLPTTTTVTVSPVASVTGQQVRLTATVSILGLPGLGVTPTGPVSFSATDGSANTSLGSSVLGFCLLTACTATLNSTSLPVGTTLITASYAGDLLAGPSSGSAPTSVTLNPNPGSSSTVNCFAGNPCDSGTVSMDASTTLDVVASSSANNQTVTASITPGTLTHCTEFEGTTNGELANFSSTATDATKTVTYTVFGAASTDLNNAYFDSGTLYLGCYASTSPFNGYTNGVYGPAPQVNEPGLGLVFEANLSSCANNSGQKPCFQLERFVGAESILTVNTTAGDPHLTGP